MACNVTACVVIADIFMAYIASVDIFMAYIVIAYLVMSYIVIAYIVTGHGAMACLVMRHIATGYIVMAPCAYVLQLFFAAFPDAVDSDLFCRGPNADAVWRLDRLQRELSKRRGGAKRP